MTLIFDSYIASIGPGIPITEQRKNCQLNVDIRYPGGFQYSVLSADNRGYAALDKGVSGTLKSTYYFSGQTAQVSVMECKLCKMALTLFLEQHHDHFRGSRQRRLLEARHSRQHVDCLVALRRYRPAQHQLAGPPD